MSGEYRSRVERKQAAKQTKQKKAKKKRGRSWLKAIAIAIVLMIALGAIGGWLRSPTLSRTPLRSMRRKLKIRSRRPCTI